MKNRIRSWPLALLVSLAGLSCAPPADLFELRCDAEGVGVTVNGTVLAGKGITTPPTAEFLVRVQIKTNVVIDKLTVGKASAVLTNAATNIWEATVFPQDLEDARLADDNRALLEIVATDLCGFGHPITTIDVPLGPALGVAVSDLTIEIVPAPADECAIPLDQSAPALVRVRASAASAGAPVTVKATQGKLIAEGATDTTASLVLQKAGNEAQAQAYFLPGASGTAVFTASAKGSLADPVTIRVVGPPEKDAPADPLTRDITYSAVFRSRGNLDECLLEETIPGAAEVLLVSPALGALTDVVSVLQEPKTCDDTETVKMTVRFSAAAPDGAALTIRCFDTFGQEAKAALAVAKKP